MVQISIAQAAVGGLLIGSSVLLLLWTTGRIAGMVGALHSVIYQGESWRNRAIFLGGLVLAGVVVSFLFPANLHMGTYEPSVGIVIASGLIMGVGSRMGNGCMSGHGVCGMGRLSPRSLVATLTFIGTGMLTVLAVHLLGGAA